jgi:predicted DsbA family dithiol-disulfide isomerase
MRARLKQVARDLELPFGDRVKTYNSRLAQELGKWAESQGKGDAFHQAVFRAYFAAGRNISDVATLVDIGTSIGLNEYEIRDVIEARTYKASVDRDWSRAYALKVTAVPFFLIKGQALIGAQPYAALEDLMRAADINRRHVDH